MLTLFHNSLPVGTVADDGSGLQMMLINNLYQVALTTWSIPEATSPMDWRPSTIGGGGKP